MRDTRLVLRASAAASLRFYAATLLALWLTVMMPWLGVSPVLASGTANCSEFLQDSRWLGEQASTTAQRHGAKATFEDWYLQQCTNPGLLEFSASEVWSNVVPTDGSFNDIIQIGAANCRAPNCQGGMGYYYAYGVTHTTPGCSTFQDKSPNNNYLASWTAANHVYNVWHASNYWNLYVDSTRFRQVPESAICWTPRSSVWFAESWDYGDQLGGTYTDHLTVSGAQYTTTEGGSWVNTSFNPSGQCNYVPTNVPFNCDVTGAQSFDMWTDR